MTADAELIRRIAGGDNAAFEELHASYTGMIKAILFTRERNPTTVDDLMQGVFEAILKAAPTFRGDSPVENWVAGIASRISKKARRDATLQRKREGRDDSSARIRSEIARELDVADLDGGGGWDSDDDDADQAELFRDDLAAELAEIMGSEPAPKRKRTKPAPPGPVGPFAGQAQTEFTEAAERTTVEAGPQDVLNAAMVFLAVLAYPESQPERDRAILAMQAFMLREAKKAGRKMPEGASAIFKAMPVQQQGGKLRRLRDRLDYRLFAARVTTNLLSGARKPGRVVPVSQEDRQATRFLLMRLGKSRAVADANTSETRQERGDFYTLNDYAARFSKSPDTFYRMVWTPEVMHLAMAFMALACRWDDPRGWDIFPLLANPGWSVDALARGERWAHLLAVAGQLVPALNGMRPERQIRLIPTDC